MSIDLLRRRVVWQTVASVAGRASRKENDFYSIIRWWWII